MELPGPQNSSRCYLHTVIKTKTGGTALDCTGCRYGRVRLPLMPFFLP